MIPTLAPDKYYYFSFKLGEAKLWQVIYLPKLPDQLEREQGQDSTSEHRLFLTHRAAAGDLVFSLSGPLPLPWRGDFDLSD